jgi:membrane protein DedA with SNARE-associated domain
MPEDIPLVLAGIAISKEVVYPPYILLICYLGVIFSDQVLFLIGYYFGNKLLSMEADPNSAISSFIAEERVNKIRDGLRRKRFLYIFIGRHFFPVRTATFLIAGSLRMPFLEFFISDLLAGFISVSLIVFLGWLIGQQLLDEEVFKHLSREFPLYITAIIFLMLTPVIYKKCKYWRIIRKRKNRN